jgi:hypothetical protein
MYSFYRAIFFPSAHNCSSRENKPQAWMPDAISLSENFTLAESKYGEGVFTEENCIWRQEYFNQGSSACLS